MFDRFGALISLGRDRQAYDRLFAGTSARKRLRESLTVAAESARGFCVHLGVDVPDDIEVIEADLALDVAAADCHAETLATLASLRERGTAIAVILNWGSRRKPAYFNLGLDTRIDPAVFSCYVRIAKPDPGIHALALDRLGVTSREVVMVGDSWKSDFKGPRARGIRAFFLDRSKSTSSDHALPTLDGILNHV